MPTAIVKSAFPSDSIVMDRRSSCALPQASITAASFTAIQTISSMPFALIASAFFTNPGKCRAEQVWVKAPGTAKRTTRFPAKYSSVDSGFGAPSSPSRCNVSEGRGSPSLIAIVSCFLARVYVANQGTPVGGGP